MADAKAKTINLLLYEGDLEGVISIEDSSWNSGELYSAPRDSVSELLETDACKKYGVYLLLSKSMVYVGQSSDLSKRITQHTVGKDWWESVVILTTKDDSLTHSDIDYLESVLIDKAFKINRLDCDNKNKGNNPKVSKFQKVVLDQYLDEALFLMQLIGITVFSDKKSGTLINTIDTKTKLALGKRAKSDAVSYLEEKGITVGKKVTYAVKQQGKDEFWANPKKDLLGQEWWLILNNNETMELVVMKVLSGSSTSHIAKALNARGISTKRGGRWTGHTINGMIKNEKYTGDVIFQKTYSDDTFTRRRNNGERDQFFAQGHHEAIISHEDFDAANDMIARNATEKGIKDWVVLGYSRRSRKAIRYAFDFWPICRLEKKKKRKKIIRLNDRICPSESVEW